MAPYLRRLTRPEALLLALLSAAGGACEDEASVLDAQVAAPVDAQTLGDAATAADAQLDASDAALNPPDANVTELPLIDHKQWRSYDAALDPLRSHQPAMVDCTPPAWFIERNMLEVNTAECNYALLEHPSLLSIAAQTQVLLELWHFDLVAPEPAKAHAALLFGDELQWETTFDIPAPGNVHQFSFRATRALAKDEPIRLHLHNHGQNTWLIASLHAVIENITP